MTSYAEFYRRSIDDRDAFWRDEAALVDWHTPFDRVVDDSRPPFEHYPRVSLYDARTGVFACELCLPVRA